MPQTPIAEQIKQKTQLFLERGFVFESLYEKGGDSSCVYICRYRKGRNFFDWREVSGGREIRLVVYVDGNYDFPSLKRLYPREYRAFALRHLLKKATMDELRTFTAQLLNTELQNAKTKFFGIPLD